MVRRTIAGNRDCVSPLCSRVQHNKIIRRWVYHFSPLYKLTPSTRTLGLRRLGNFTWRQCRGGIQRQQDGRAPRLYAAPFFHRSIARANRLRWPAGCSQFPGGHSPQRSGGESSRSPEPALSPRDVSRAPDPRALPLREPPAVLRSPEAYREVPCCRRRSSAAERIAPFHSAPSPIQVRPPTFA